MNQKPVMKYLPYIVAVVVFLLITWIFFNPVFEGKRVRQGDNINYLGMAKEIRDYRLNTGQEALWTNSMFGGMPAYQISFSVGTNLIPYIDKIFLLDLPSPAGLFFLYLIGFFILLLVLEVDPWLSIAGAIAFALSSYFIIIIEAGHNSKVHAIGYMAPVIAGIILCLRKKYLLGGILTALFMALEFNAGHPQIAYYLLIIILFILGAELINTIKTKLYKDFSIAVAVIAVAGIISILPNFTSTWATYEYGKYTIRGKTELTSEKQNRTSGLDKDYATDWSYGIAESFSLMIPNVKGGVSQPIGENETALKNVDSQYKESIAGSGQQYWGEQPFTSGPVYAGAAIMFFFVLGLFFVKGRMKWALLALTVLSIMLGWGKNFWGLTNFFLEYMPLYNKFRAVSMTLVIAEIAIPLLAILAANEILKNPGMIKQHRRNFFIALGLTGGISLLFYLLPAMFFDFLSSDDVRQKAMLAKNPKYDIEQINGFFTNLEIARISIFKADAIRSFLFIILSAAAVWLYSIKKFAKPVFIAVIILIVLIDLYPVDKRYLNEKNFVEKNEMENPFKISKADELILTDKSPDYRVLNMAVSTFNDASTSYYHMSIGGYHGAKLRRYQEIIENCLYPEIEKLRTVLQSKPDQKSLFDAMKNLPALNMLNAKYIIYNPEAPPLTNEYALGNAWFVNDYKLVDNADAEIHTINTLNPKTTAVIDKRFSEDIKSIPASVADSSAKIKLDSYKPNQLIYSSSSTKERLAVFSEIYYDKGWKATIDGKPADYLRADYILRAMVIPTGNHKIEFKFEPTVYFTGKNISLFGSLLLIVSLLIAGFLEVKAVVSCKTK